MRSGKPGGRKDTVIYIEGKESAPLSDDRRDAIGNVPDLGAEIAHQIRNPLGSIELFASLLLKDCRRENDRRRIEQILGAVKTINQCLSGYMMPNRSRRAALRELNLHELLREIVGYSEIIADNSDVFFRIRYADREPVVAGDREILKHLFVNLIIHALQSLAKGCYLLIETQVREGGNGEGLPAGPGGSLCIRFAGVDWMKRGESERNSPFAVFMTSNHKHAGLGFAILHSIMDLHGGFFTLQAEETGGVNLNIFFPVQALQERVMVSGPVNGQGVE
mgnify:CR=1 FL=1